MKVYIASKKMRGPWAPRPPNSILVDVTSAQKKNAPNRLVFSPMSEIEGSYKGFYCFENYWQSGRVIEGVDRTKQLAWWKKQTSGKRRYPGSKDKKVLHAQWNDGPQLNYIQSRKQIYVPEYYQLIKESEVLKNYQRIVSETKGHQRVLVVYDFDGPRKDDGSNEILEVTLEMLKEKINNPTFPFGHGYIVAAAISGFKPTDYID